MKVILLQDVKKQGKKDQIIDVSDGYAKYLINNKLGVAATDSNKKILDKNLKNRELKEQELIIECQKLQKKLEKINLNFKIKTGANDKVFGNISVKQISEELNKLGYNLDKKNIHLVNNMDSLGTHQVEIELHKKVKFKINVTLSK